MKKLILIFLSIVLAGSLLAANGQSDSVYGNGSGNGRGAGMGRGNGAGRMAVGSAGAGQDLRFAEDLTAILSTTAADELSAAEREGLIYLYQEEKLARDVYTALYETWNLQVFRNIAESEQQHMDAVGFLLERYAMEAPVDQAAAGEFADERLQSLYGELTAAGRESVVAALTAGATIEDLDIADLQQLAAVDNDDVRLLYQNLMKGSRNHLRSFLRQLDREGADYTPQYIEDEYFATILGLNQEVAPITDPDYRL